MVMIRRSEAAICQIMARNSQGSFEKSLNSVAGVALLMVTSRRLSATTGNLVTS